MTLPARSPRSANPPSAFVRHLGRVAVAIAVLALLTATVPSAHGGEDDFEFGKKLAEAQYFDYARMVYDRILKASDSSEVRKDEARYGLALLRKEEALAATGRKDAKYEDIVALFESASKDIEDFASKNPKNDKAGQARLDVGTIRLAFVQWARELLDDPGEIEERAYDAGKLSDDARTMIDKAIDYFKGLRPPESETKPKPYQVLAAYYYVISQYFRALVEPPGSPSQMSALEKAGRDLDDYIIYHDGQLLGVYAMDIYGLVWWEMAKCEQDPEKKLANYNKAFEWFESCIYTDDEGPDHLRVITSGYYHIAQAGADAGRTPERNFARDALTYLESMLEQHPTAWRTDNGLRAMIEWANLECMRGNAAKAIEVATSAGKRAETAGKDYLSRLANRKLTGFISGDCGGSVTGLVDPGVLNRVAKDLFESGKYAEAIRAYRAVITATPDTTKAFLEFRWDAWTKMAAAYKKLDDRMGEALALEPIHDAWIQGRIPRETGKSEDPNLTRSGFERRRAQKAYEALAEATGSQVFRDRQVRIADRFVPEYPDHSSSGASEWNSGIRKWRTGLKQKRAKDQRWRKTLQAAAVHFERVAKEPKSQAQDQAWVYLVRIPFELGDYAAAAATAKRAWAAWSTPEAKAQELEFETIRARRESAQSEVVLWQGRALKEEGKFDEVIALLTPYHSTYPNKTKPYPSMARDALVQSHLAKGEIEAADRHYRALLGSDPKYYNLTRITYLLAGHFDKQRTAIHEKLGVVTSKLNEVRRDLKAAADEAFRLSALYADLNLSQSKALEAIRVNEEALADGRDGVDLEILRKAEETIEELKTKLPAIKANIDKVVPERDRLQVEKDALLAEQAAYRQEIYEPLTMAAGYYYEWDRANKANEISRLPDNVSAFAGMFWSAGRLRPAAIDNWEKARELYEEYLAFPKVMKLSKTHPHKRSAIGRLGDVYVNLAKREQDVNARRDLVNRAVELLQNSIAERAADNELVVGMLADKILVLTWRGPSGKRWRFPIPRPATVKALRDSVKNLGKEGGPPLPTFEDEQDRKAFERALGLFRRALNAQNDEGLQDLVTRSGTSTFDPYLYRDLANYTPEFRLALAWIYSHTGREEDVPKAVNLTLSLTAGPIAVEEDSEEWWRAREIQMFVYMRTAERRLTEGTGSAEATQWLDRAGKIFKGLAASFPKLGDEVIPGNKKLWTGILVELDGLRAKAGMSVVGVNLTEPLPGTDPADDTDSEETDANETEGN